MCARYSAAEAAATIHYHMVVEPEHGYAQDNRYGDDGWCSVESQGFTFTFPSGDRDCSRSVCEAWQLALSVTPYAGVLDDAYWTGNMYDVFRNSGLFEPWYTYETIAQRGDVYLTHNDTLQHTAMCQSAEPDMLSEFLSNEWGGIVNGQSGDQTGWESVYRPYYDAPWTYTLHYNGKADFEMDDNIARELRDALLNTHTSDAQSIGDTSITSTKNRVDWIDYRVGVILERAEEINGKLDRLMKAFADIDKEWK